MDNRDERVRQVAPLVTEAVCFDATDEDALGRAGPDQRDVCVCAMGDESREGSIICTALLRQMGARRVIARANDAVHARILRLVGAHEVVNPERAFGERFAAQILHADIMAEMPLGGGLRLTELRVPEALQGKTLVELELPRRRGVTVVAVRHGGEETVLLPDPRASLRAEDRLIVVSKEDAVERLMDET